MDTIALVRRFNRTVTQQIGALESSYLGRPRPLGASRALFEIGLDGLEVRQLRTRLSLDSGYASRLLRQLEAQELIRTGPAPADSRARFVKLTGKGRKELAVLNRLSDVIAKSLLDPLTPSQRSDLTAAMEKVERLLLAGAVRLTIEDPESRAAQQCIARYYHELAERFDTGFDPARSIAVGRADFAPPRGCFVMATLNGEAIGCGGLRYHSDYGEIKRMWVAGSCRGLGVGKRILHHLEELTRKRRLPFVRLETNKALAEAQAMYRSNGYREVKPFSDEVYAHHWFEKKL
jgi:DNA-binding MarR family transcriptional regulator/GNAT superfamily N-acetyltransferase